MLTDSGGGEPSGGWEGDRVRFKEEEEFVVVLSCAHWCAHMHSSLSPSVPLTAGELAHWFTLSLSNTYLSFDLFIFFEPL